MHEVLVNRLGGLSLPRKSVVRLTDRPDMTLDVYRGRKTTIQQYNQHENWTFSIFRERKITCLLTFVAYLREFIPMVTRWIDLSAIKGRCQIC